MITRLVRTTLLATALLSLASAVHAQAPAPKVEFPALSPSATLKQRFGLTDVEINYSRPSARGRAIFGGLVPYGEVWRTGANSATKIKFSTAVVFGGAAVPAGNYELFTIPGKTEWTVIIAKDSSQWGAYSYKQENDVVRVKATPETLATPVESFGIEFSDLKGDSATLAFSWATTRVPVKITADVVSTLQPQIEAVMASDAPKKPYFNAAMFYYENHLDLAKAAAWITAAIAEQPDAFYMVYRKGLILAAAGDKAGALAAAQASLAAAEKTKGPIGEEYTKLNQALIASLK